MKPSTPQAVKLFHQGQLALSRMESNGMRIDVKLLDKTIKKVKRRIKQFQEELREDEVWRVWRKAYGSEANMTSLPQFAHVLYDKLGYKCVMRTDPSDKYPEGQNSVNDANLMGIKLPFAQKYRRLARYNKLDGTFLKGIKDNVCGEYLHASFALNLAATFRTSCNDPNLQNLPIRDPETAKLIRSLFIARDGHVLLEADFSGIEVAVACCANKDPNLIYDYTEGDMHRDFAIRAYCIDPKTDKGWWKDKSPTGGHNPRYCAKNKLVFPEFYGSYYVDCATHLWEGIFLLDLHAPSGLELNKHLKKFGIRELGACDPEQRPRKGTFEYHIQEVEQYMWQERYKVYTAWKRGTWDEYQRKGYCKLFTGFVCSLDSSGMPMNRKQVINYQIQGPAAHCLLWVLIQMDRWLRKNKMKTRIISEIHDSVLLDVAEKELDAVVEHLRWLMEVHLQKTWKWVIVPMKAELEVTKTGGSWYKKGKIVA